jgi:hypothetical protein
MRRRLHLLLGLLLAALLCTTSTWAAPPASDLIIDAEALHKLGINDTQLTLGVVSTDGSLVICYERERDLKRIAEHKLYQLRVFHISWPTHKYTVDSIWLPLTRFDQLSLTGDGKHCVVIGDYGRNFIDVDLTTKKARTIFRHARGGRGFRSMPTVCWVEKQKVHTLGYYYDEGETLIKDAVVSIDTSLSGLDALHEVRDISGLIRSTLNYQICMWHASDQAYFGGFETDKLCHLFGFNGTEQLQRLDQALRYDAIAVGQDRVFVVAKKSKTDYDMAIYDPTHAGKAWHMGDPKTRYQYLYMSKDGTTALCTHFDYLARRMTMWYAHQKDGYALHPLPQIQQAVVGTVRLSPGGQVFGFLRPAGLLVGHIPTP